MSRWNSLKEKLTFHWKMKDMNHTKNDKSHIQDKNAKIPCPWQRKWKGYFFNHRKTSPLPRKMNVPFNEEKYAEPWNTKNIKTVQHIKLREHSARLPAKMNMILFNHRKTLRMPRKMHVLKFIGGHRLKCLVSEWKEKNTRFACTKGKFRKWRRRDTGFAGIYRIFIILSLDTYNGTCCIVSGP